MKLTLPRKKLIDALNLVAVGLSQSKFKVFGGFVLLKCDGKTLTATTDSTVIRAEASLDCPDSKDGVALVNHVKLLTLLQSGSENVELWADDGKLLVKTGSRPNQLSIAAHEGFPPPRESSQQQAFVVLDNKSFAYSLSVARQCCDDGLSNEWSDCILIRDNESDLMLLGGNAGNVCKVLLPTCGQKFSASIPANETVKISAAIKTGDSLSMIVREGSVEFTMDGFVVSIQQTHKQFPDFDAFFKRFDKELTYSITINREELLNHVSIGGAILDNKTDDGLGFEITTQPQAIIIESHSKSHDSYRAEIACAVKEPKARGRYNFQKIATHLRSLDCENVTLFYGKENPGVKFSPENSTATAFCTMPWRD